MRTVKVELGSRSYEVHIGPGMLDRLGYVAHQAGFRRAAVITDSTVGPLYGQKAIDSLTAAGVGTTLITFPAGEQNKTLATVGTIFDRLLTAQPPIDRKTLIVALGGGVAGDIAGFVAATALRGIPFFQCPTTLLADVDASVGGKTGVDHPAGKNLIGAFHQPRAVLIDVATLAGLPADELRNGLAECVKHGVIRDAGLLDLLEQNAQAIFACDHDALTDLVARNVAIKAAVVSADEREAGQREYLNFGHTVGHALETLAGYNMSHGQAVSLGMTAACQLAAGLGFIDQPYAARVEALLKSLGLPVRSPLADCRMAIEIMRRDKKARDGRIRMVLPTGPGTVETFEDIAEADIATAIEYIRN